MCASVHGQRKTSDVLLCPLPLDMSLNYQSLPPYRALYHTQIFMWVLGIRTQVFMLVEQEIFCTEPSGRWILIYRNLLGFAQSAG